MLKIRTVEDSKRRLKKSRALKERYSHLFENIGQYVHQQKTDFSDEIEQGDFSTDEIFDTTAPEAAIKSASALAGMLWQGGESILLQAPKGLPNSKAIKEYFEKITDEVKEVFNDPEAAFADIWVKDLYEQLTFGTSGIGVFKGQVNEPDYVFKLYDVLDSCIVVNSKGVIIGIFYERNLCSDELIEEFGEENVSAEVKEAYHANNLDKKFKVVQDIYRNPVYSTEKEGNKYKMFGSLHYEEKSKKTLKRSGYDEMPIAMRRYFTRNKDTYGWSPSSYLMPTILGVNYFAEMICVGVEKKLDPALGVLNDGVLGGNELDTSAGSISVFNLHGRAGIDKSPVFPIYTVGEIREAENKVTKDQETINRGFNIDKLLDFSTNVQMTLGEASMREKIRAQGLSSNLSRNIKTLNRIYERTTSMMFRDKRLGYFADSPEAIQAQEVGLEDILIIPDEVAKLIKEGKEFYTIKHVTPAQKMLNVEAGEGAIRTYQFLKDSGDASMMLWIDPKETISIVRESTGAPSRMLRSEEEYNEISQQLAEQQQQQAEMEKAQQLADMAGKAKGVISEQQAG